MPGIPQELAQAIAGALHPHLERRLSGTGQGGHILVAQLLDVFEQKRFTLIQREPRKGAADLLIPFDIRIARRRCPIVGDGGLAVALEWIPAHQPTAAPIHQNPQDPRAEAVGVAGSDGTPGAQQCVLQGLLRLLTIAEEVEGIATEARAVPDDQVAEGCDVSGTDPKHQLGIRHAHWRMTRRDRHASHPGGRCDADDTGRVNGRERNAHMHRSRYLMILLGFALGACGADNGPGDGIARVRLLHANPDAPAVDLVVDGRTVAEAIAYTQVSAFADVEAGQAGIFIEVPGALMQYAVRDVDLEPGARYTVLYGAAGAEDGLVLVADTATGVPTEPPPSSPADTGAIPGEDKVKLRVIHNAPDAPPLDVYLTAEGEDLAGAFRLIEPFSYGTGTSPEFPGYVERDPGVYRVRFTADNTLDVLFDTGPVSMAAGQVRSFVLFSSDTTGVGVAVVRER